MKEEYDYIVNAFTMENENTNLEVDNLSVGCITSKNNNFELDKEGNLTVKSIKTTKYIPLNNEVLDTFYPVGSIYMSVNNVNPKEFFGGEWEQLKDRFLLGAGDTYQNGSTGGEKEHILSVNEMPAHTHNNILVTGIPLTINSSGGSGAINVAQGSSGATPTVNPLYVSLTGGNKAHNNMPPYLVVNIWKRVS